MGSENNSEDNWELEIKPCEETLKGIENVDFWEEKAKGMYNTLQIHEGSYRKERFLFPRTEYGRVKGIHKDRGYYGKMHIS